MRISTNQLYDVGISGIQQLESEQLKVQQQISTSKRILTPSDDPVGSAAVLNVTQSKTLNDQYSTNAGAAQSQLGLEDGALGDATTLLQNVKTLVVNAGNAALSDSDRASIATEIQGYYQEMLSIANRTDGTGNYLFSGYKGATQPFIENSPGNVSYAGDSGQHLIQVGAARYVATGDSGDSVFSNIKNGNGVFVASAAGANTGSAVIGASGVTNRTQWDSAPNPKDISIKFSVNSSVTPPVTTYDIVDNVHNVSLLTGAAPAATGPYLRTYTPGASISLKTQSPPDTNPTSFDYGASLTVNGTPATGDSLSIKPSTNQDIFTTLNNVISALNTPSSGNATASAVLGNAINAASLGVDNSLNNVLTVRASVGARLKEGDDVKSSSDSLSLQYTQQISDFQSLDYAQAVSDLSQQQLSLQAAQQSFLKITSLNLFSML